MNEDKDDGLYRVVLWTAAVLAVVILYFGGRRLLRAPAAEPPREPPVPQVSSDAVPARSFATETPPSVLPPIKLLRVEGKRTGTRRRAIPPAIPQPPIQQE